MCRAGRRPLAQHAHAGARGDAAAFRAISNTVRRARAEQLIAEGRMTMTEIAAELGFSDLSSFSQAFRRWSGAAPIALKGAPIARAT
ncbi:MAG: helix-turn-helix domain-containing protein [Proteobacteria bacterium]|nr:helix-turn-helix domain-containing protein [Pseudomonadota bacterium]